MEGESDVCEGTSRQTAALCMRGMMRCREPLKAKLNVRGNEMMEELSKLDFPFRRNGSLVLCFERRWHARTGRTVQTRHREWGKRVEASVSGGNMGDGAGDFPEYH